MKSERKQKFGMNETELLVKGTIQIRLRVTASATHLATSSSVIVKVVLKVMFLVTERSRVPSY